MHIYVSVNWCYTEDILKKAFGMNCTPNGYVYMSCPLPTLKMVNNPATNACLSL